MFSSWGGSRLVLDLLRYDTAANLLEVLDRAVIKPALDMERDLLERKAENMVSRHVSDFLDAR